MIATHSPFLLAMGGAKVYDLDSVPVRERRWWELESVRVYFDFFKSREELFLNSPEDAAVHAAPKRTELRPRFRLLQLMNEMKLSPAAVQKLAGMCRKFEDKDAIAAKLIAVLSLCESEKEALDAAARLQEEQEDL